MEDIVLLLDKNDLAVTLEGNSLRIQQADDKTRHVPLGMLGQMVVYGRPPVSCDVWRALADRNIPAVLLPGRGRGGAAYMGGGLSASVRARAAQHEALRNPKAAAAVRRWVLDKKIAGHVMLAGKLAGMAEAAAGKNEPMRLFGGEVSRTGLVEKAARTVEIMENRRLALANETGADAMMGHEGVAANAWYEFLIAALPEEWRFSGRNRRPPLDPVNALMSLGYTLAMSEMRGAVCERGLDPCFGFLHALESGRPSLVLDLIEPLRPCADAFVLSLLGDPLQPSDFTTSGRDGCRLSKDGRSSYYREWTEWRNAWPADLLGYGETPDGGSPEEKPLKNCCRWIIGEVVRLFGNA